MFAHIKELFTRPSGYKISRSLRFRSSASAYLNRTNGTPTSTTTTTISFWIKRGTLGVQNNVLGAGQASGTNYSQILFSSADVLNIGESSGTGFSFITTQVFRDPSAWYHIVFVYDSTQATSTNRLKLYVNGVQVTSFSTTVYPALNQAYLYNTSAYIKAFGNIWYNGGPGGFPFDGYLTEINFIDGQALTPSSFGQTNTITGIWQPIKYTGTYGNNGFYLNFSDNSNNTATTIGKDYSGNGNNFTPTNISVTAGVTYDSMLDVPTLYADGGNGRGNYAVLNPISATNQARGTIADGNLTGTVNITGPIIISTFEIPTNLKVYVEFTANSGISSAAAGLTDVGVRGFNDNYTQTDVATYLSDARKTIDGATTSYGATYTNGNVIGMAIDAANKTVEFFKDGTTQGAITWSSNYATLYVGISARGGSAGARAGSINFGQRPFTYTPPTGFVALNTQNLPTPTISNGAQYMAATTYTGTGSARSVVNAGGFQPDFVWIKNRTSAYDNYLYDAIRGVNVVLVSNNTGAEATQTDGLNAFLSNGFSIAGNRLNVNENGSAIVAWQWQAGKGSTSSNTSGSITSTVSVGATQGFSVVTYTGTGANATVGHGLGVAPKMIIVKDRGGVNSWFVQTSTTGASAYLLLNGTAASATDVTVWNATAPTSTVFSVGTNSAANQSTRPFVAYCFSEVAGFSKAFSFTGNGSTDGAFTYLGFRPRMVLLKRTDTTGNWYIWDTSRNTYNVLGEELYPNLSNAGSTATDLDLLSNGFKMRNSTAGFNASGGTYIGFAWAENPFKYSLGM